MTPIIEPLRKMMFLSALFGFAAVASMLRRTKGAPNELYAKDDPIWNVSNERAIEIFKGRGVVLSGEYYSYVDDLARTRAFTISGITQVEVLEHAAAKLTEAIEAGHTRTWFEKELGKLAPLSAFHLETIFRTNAATVFMASKWEGIETAQQYIGALQYVGVDDDRTRHRDLFGMTAPADDPIWDTYYPPLEFNCRCDVKIVARSDIDDGKVKLTNMEKQKLPEVPESFQQNVGKAIYGKRDKTLGLRDQSVVVPPPKLKEPPAAAPVVPVKEKPKPKAKPVKVEKPIEKPYATQLKDWRKALTPKETRLFAEWKSTEYKNIRAVESKSSQVYDKMTGAEKAALRKDVNKLNTLIARAPNYQKDVFRGTVMEKELADAAFVKGNGYELRAMSSFSTKSRIAHKFAGMSATDNKPVRIVLRINNKGSLNCADITRVAGVRIDETEVLVAKTRFKITSVKKTFEQIANETLETRIVELERW